MRLAASLLALACTAGLAHADITALALGPDAPPAAAGGYTFTTFPDDGLGGFTQIGTLPSPLGGSLSFDGEVQAVDIGDGWLTWSHGYAGDVYSSGGQTHLTITLPENTGAFYLYAEPNTLATQTITVSASDGTRSATLVQDVKGDSGACGYAFWATCGSSVKTVDVTCDLSFAVGEFGISGPCSCLADCNHDGRLNVNDFICFQVQWRLQTGYGDFNHDGKWNINDFLQFQGAFVKKTGCH